MIPVNKNLITKLVEEPEKKGSLILPKNESNTRTYEIVVAPDNPHGIRVGDKVLVSRYKVVEADVAGWAVYIMSYEDVLAILEKCEAVSALSQDK